MANNASLILLPHHNRYVIFSAGILNGDFRSVGAAFGALAVHFTFPHSLAYAVGVFHGDVVNRVPPYTADVK